MKKYVTKRRVALLAGLAVAASFAVAGYAYFTNNGSGTGSASVGTSSGIVITNDNQSADLFPGGPAVTVDLHLNDPGAGNQYVGTVVRHGRGQQRVPGLVVHGGPEWSTTPRSTLVRRTTRAPRSPWPIRARTRTRARSRP